MEQRQWKECLLERKSDLFKPLSTRIRILTYTEQLAKQGDLSRDPRDLLGYLRLRNKYRRHITAGYDHCSPAKPQVSGLIIVEVKPF